MAGERLLDEAKRKNRWDWATVPDDLPEYWMYGALDPVLNSHLLAKHMPVVRQQFGASYDLEIAYARLCANMMNAGMMIDVPYIRFWIDQTQAWLNDAMAWLRGQWGVESVSSNRSVGEALQDAGVVPLRTPTGLAKIDKDTMAEYQVRYPEAALLISRLRFARKSEDIINRYLQKFLDMAVDDVIHYSIHSVGAQATGRSSVTSPPMQTFDRDIPMIRGAFRPRPGHVFVSWDAAQIEIRLAAIFSGDQQLMADIARCDATGESFFVLNAERIYKTKIAKDDPRYTHTKNTIYAVTYGSGPETAAITAGVSLAQLQPIYDGFKSAYPTLARNSMQLISKAKQAKRPYIRTLYGSHLMLDRGREYAGVDYRIQGSAAQILKQSALHMDAAGLGHMLRLDIHDEHLSEVPIEQAEEVARAGTEILTDRTTFPLPILWEAKIHRERWQK